MSLINKVLRDLDERHAIPGGHESVRKVRPVDAKGAGGQEWFWRVVALLTLVALGWVAWVVYQIQPRPIATELAGQAAEQARAQPAQTAVAPPASPTPPVATPAVEAPKAAPQAAEAPKPAPEQPTVAAADAPKPTPRLTQPVETLRLAPSIETPIAEPTRKPVAAPEKLKPAPKAAETARKAEKPATIAGAGDKPRVERRDRVLTAEERAETDFRRGVDLLKRGRAIEAEAAFNASLQADVRHRGARQALVALAFERSELESARRLLAAGLAIEPAQPDFAVALARIHVEQGDLNGALAAMQPTIAAATSHPDFHVLRGTILQRLKRSGEAADAYRSALHIQAKLPQAWIGLGMSLEALEKKPEAAEAFKRALAAGPVSADVRTFAEQRIRALR